MVKIEPNILNRASLWLTPTFDNDTQAFNETEKLLDMKAESILKAMELI